MADGFLWFYLRFFVVVPFVLLFFFNALVSYAAFRFAGRSLKAEWKRFALTALVSTVLFFAMVFALGGVYPPCYSFAFGFDWTCPAIPGVLFSLGGFVLVYFTVFRFRFGLPDKNALLAAFAAAAALMLLFQAASFLFMTYPLVFEGVQYV